MKIYVKQLYDDKGEPIKMELPSRGTPRATGYDVVATSGPTIKGTPGPGEAWESIDYIQYETNLFMAPETLTHDLKFYPRSSVRKYNLSLANCVPIIDNDYRGQVYLCFKYLWQPEDLVFCADASGALAGLHGAKVNFDKIYKKGDKIAQLTVDQVIPAEFVLVDDLEETERGAGGFGSTDQPKGKPLVQVFAEEEMMKKSSILDKYKEVGGVHTPMPYSEQIKKRES